MSNFHGSDIERIENIYGISKENLINFSSNVNPLGMSQKIKSAIIDNIYDLELYPDRDSTEIKKSISTYTSVDFNNIIIGNGASEVTKIVFEILKPKKVLIIGPTYSEYESDLNKLNADIDYFLLEQSEDFVLNLLKLSLVLEKKYDLLVICNPNNPTSTLLENNTLENIVRIANEHNMFVCIDETYIEFVEDFYKINDYSVNLLHNKNCENLIVIRGVSKFFSLPGLRFGYGMTNNKEIIEHTNNLTNTWSVNSLVRSAVSSLSKDIDFCKEANQLINFERDRVVERLSKIKNIKIFMPKANFILIKILNEKTSSEIFESAMQYGLILRDCSNFYGLDNKFIRFCFLDNVSNEKMLVFLENELA